MCRYCPGRSDALGINREALDAVRAKGTGVLPAIDLKQKSGAVNTGWSADVRQDVRCSIGVLDEAPHEPLDFTRRRALIIKELLAIGFHHRGGLHNRFVRNTLRICPNGIKTLWAASSGNAEKLQLTQTESILCL